MRKKYPMFQYVLGDVRDERSVRNAIAGHDIVVHAAAMKRIPECEEQPRECWETNVIGSANVLHACVMHHVTKCVGVSTDKACNAVTMYGASKLAMERLFMSMQETWTQFNCVRYGNVLDSNGSVIDTWREQYKANKVCTITDKRMTRFWLSPKDAVLLIEETLQAPSHSVYIPKAKAISILQLLLETYHGAMWKETGLRSAEKLHEDLVSTHETVIEYKSHFLLYKDGDTGLSWNSSTCPILTRAELEYIQKDVDMLKGAL